MKKNLTKSIILMIIMVMAVVTLTGCSALPNAEEPTKDELEGLTAYVADEDMEGYTKCEAMEGVEFYYPSNYKSVGKETQPMFMDPDIAGASVNIVSETFPARFTFEGYIEASIIGIKQQMTIKDDEVKTEYINLNGTKAAKLSYVATSQGQTMTITQVAIVKESKVYILTIGGLEKDAESLQPKMDKMIKSFK